MKFMGATWRRSGLSKAAMRAYYNDVHGPIVAEDPAGISRYIPNVVEDAVIYCGDPHPPLTAPDGLTELYAADQDAFVRAFSSPHFVNVAWPDTAVYADLTRAISVAGDEQPVFEQPGVDPAAPKAMAFILVPPGTDRRIGDLWDRLADVLRAQPLDGMGVTGCHLVTEYERPNDFIRKLFDRPGVRAVAGMTMTLEPGATWELRGLADALIAATSEAFEAEAFLLLMSVTPNIVIM